jgi:hypothetical protein
MVDLRKIGAAWQLHDAIPLEPQLPDLLDPNDGTIRIRSRILLEFQLSEF